MPELSIIITAWFFWIVMGLFISFVVGMLVAPMAEWDFIAKSMVVVFSFWLLMGVIGGSSRVVNVHAAIFDRASQCIEVEGERYCKGLFR